MNWTPEQDDKLRDMWLGKGSPASWIGRELGVTRNAVIGRVNRLGLVRDKDESRKARRAEIANAAARARNKRRSEAAVTAIASALAEAEKQAPALISAPRFLPQTSGTTIDDLRHRDCRYALWGRDRPPLSQQFYCGAPALAGQSWCAKHRPIVFRPIADVMERRRRIFRAAAE